MSKVMWLSLLVIGAGCSGGSNANLGTCTTVGDMCLFPAPAVAGRTPCGDVTDYCDTADKPLSLACVATPPIAAPSVETVTLTGFLAVLGTGGNTDGISVAVYDAAPILKGRDIATSTPLALEPNVVLDPATQRACDVDERLGCSIPSQTGCASCNDGYNGHYDGGKYCRDNGGGNFSCNDRLRWEARYTLTTALPTNAPLLVRVTGANGLPNQNWANVVIWNVVLSTSDHVCASLSDNHCNDGAGNYQLDVTTLSQNDYGMIPSLAGLSGGIVSGRGAVYGEVRDCDQVRVGNAVVGISPLPDRSSYFDGNPFDILPDSSRVATDRIGRYLGLSLLPGPVDVVAAGLTSTDGSLTEIGSFSGYVYADTFSIIDLN